MQVPSWGPWQLARFLGSEKECHPGRKRPTSHPPVVLFGVDVFLGRGQLGRELFCFFVLMIGCGVETIVENWNEFIWVCCFLFYLNAAIDS